jgi:hypothetical protein
LRTFAFRFQQVMPSKDGIHAERAAPCNPILHGS